LHDQVKTITNENVSLYERVARTPSSPIIQSTSHLPEM
jgi:hypothetical protein